MNDFSIDALIKIPNNQKFLMLGLIIAAIIGSYIYFVHMPSKDTLMLLEEQLTKLQTKYNEQQKVLADLPKFEREIKELELQFAKSLKLLPNNREIPSLLTNISTLAQESGLNILLFQPKPEVTKDFYAEIPVDMMVSGEYHNIGYFFDKISKLNRIVNISEIEINSDKKKIKNDKSNYLQSSFQAVTFKFVEKEKDSVINKKTKKPKSKR